MANNIAIIGSSVVLLVAVVAIVAVTVSTNRGPSSTNIDSPTSTSSKSVQSLCMPTDYRQTCESALDGVGGNTTDDPKELIQLGFNVTISHIRSAFTQSQVLQQAAKDPKNSEALETCRELLDYAIDDLRASFDKLAGIDMSRVDDAINDLQSWLAAAYTYQDICLDDFEDVSSPTAVGMQKALNLSMEMTSNINVMIGQIQPALDDFDVSSFSRRKLLAEEEGENLPSWVSGAKRRLLAVPLTEISPHVTVAQDGSGNYKTVTEALATVPKKNPTPFVIHIKEGTYKEKILIDKSQPNVVLVGDGATKTVITYGSNFAIEGTGTSKTATVAVQGANFMARDIGFENSAGPEGHQAVALRVNAEFAVLYNCRMDGYQDTLYPQNYRQFYRDCTITGTVDFIFGNGIAILQNCQILVRKPLENQQNMVTAQGRMDRHLATALVIQNCTIMPDPSLVPSIAKNPTYLGRPWKPYARTVFLQNYIDGFISPVGYTPWLDEKQQPVNYKSCYYTELGNRGPGADTSKRVNWPSIKKIDAKQAQKYTVERFLQGNKWLPATGVPFIPGILPSAN